MHVFIINQFFATLLSLMRKKKDQFYYLSSNRNQFLIFNTIALNTEKIINSSKGAWKTELYEQNNNMFWSLNDKYGSIHEMEY